MADNSDQWRGAASGAVSGALLGTEILPGWGTAIGAVAGGALGYFGTPKRPKYNLLPESDQNKALASQAAFGTSQATSQGVAQAEQDAAEATNTAQNYSANTGSILNVLKSVNANKNQTIRGYMGDLGQQQTVGRSQLMGANLSAIDEQDKAWNYNVNLPYQNRVAQNREFQKGSMENYWRLLDSIRARKVYQTPDNTDNWAGV